MATADCIPTVSDTHSVCVDTLTISFAGAIFGYDVALVRNWIQRISRDVLSLGGKLTARYNGYAECWALVMADGHDAEAPKLGWLGVSMASDNMRGRWCLHLTGAGCACFSSWDHLVADAVAYSVKITRVDVALDDLTGAHSVAMAQRLWQDGAFTLSGRPPRCQYVQNSHDAGDTFYVGRRQSGKILRVYDKGKQLAGAGRPLDPSAIAWTRWELELHSKDRCIPLDVLLHPASYLKGAYPAALCWMSGDGVMLKTLVIKTLLTLDRMLHFAKQQVGRLVRYFTDHGLSADAIVSDLSAEPGRYPLRLFEPGLDVDLSTGAFCLSG